MRERIGEQARLTCRLADVERCIGEHQGQIARGDPPWYMPDQAAILDLLEETLNDLEARKGALERDSQKRSTE
jgi:hypothetical protein